MSPRSQGALWGRGAVMGVSLQKGLGSDHEELDLLRC